MVDRHARRGGTLTATQLTALPFHASLIAKRVQPEGAGQGAGPARLV